MTVHYLSKYFTKFGNVEQGRTCLSSALMLAYGLIHRTGTYAFLPMGQRVLNKLIRIVERELDNVGAQKCSLPAIGFSGLWKKSGRWDKYGSGIFRFSDSSGVDACLQPTCEEMITSIVADMGSFRSSMYPLMLYQIISDVYRKIFYNHLELNELLVVKADTGEIGGSLSHEYHLPNPAAEDSVISCSSCSHAFVRSSDTKICEKCGKPLEIPGVKSVEVAHTFQLGTVYSEIFGCGSSKKKPYFMGCYGLGISSIDVLSVTPDILRLPTAIAPFKVAVVTPKVPKDHYCQRYAEDLIYQLSQINGLSDEILVDDRSESTGRRLVDLKRLGIPNIIVVPTLKHIKPEELIKTVPKNAELLNAGNFWHSELLPMAQNW